MNQPNRPILVLDDDASFYSIVASILDTQGREVIGARTAREANRIVASTNPVLAIVDFHLPLVDGITWIEEMRSVGKNFPIVFLSGIRCDKKTFNLLRNILKVSLILTKPIVPEIFVGQLESLLPKRLSPLRIECDTESDTVSNTTVPVESQTVSEPSGQKPEDGSSDMQRKLAVVRAEYARNLSELWSKLTSAAHLAQAEPDNTEAIREAVRRSHQIKGTAGSLRFDQIKDVALKVEELLYRIAPNNDSAPALWPEVFQLLTEGEALALEVGSQTELPSQESEEHASNGEH